MAIFITTAAYEEYFRIPELVYSYVYDVWYVYHGSRCFKSLYTVVVNAQQVTRL